MPRWTPDNLNRHYRKRITEDAGCFEDLMGICDRSMTKEEYVARTHHAFRTAWGEYEAESKEIGDEGYYSQSVYFVDQELVVAVTTASRHEYKTCFHEHFGRRHGEDRSNGESAGNLQLRYRDNLQKEEQGQVTRNVKRIRGV